MHKYKLNRFTGSFISRITEARYFDSIRDSLLNEIKNFFLIGLTVYWLYTIVDFFLINKPETMAMIALKIIPTVSSLLIYYLLKKIHNYQLFYGLSFINLVILIFSSIYVFINHPEEPMQTGMTELIFLLTVSLIMPSNFFYSVAISFIGSVIFSAMNIHLYGYSIRTLTLTVFTFSVYNILLVYFTRRSQIQSRLKYRELVKEKKYINVLHKEILKRAELEKKLTEMACRDSLTGIYSRGFFLDIVEHEITKCIRKNCTLSIMLMDVDNFKIINDTYGHAMGDLALKELIKISQATIRKSDIIGRLGGEEFAILCPESDKKNTYEIASRLCKEIEKNTKNENYHFTVSIGIAEIIPNKNLDQTLHLADLALYEAKREGKNRVKVA